MVSPLLDMLLNCSVRHAPDMACEPAGPADTRFEIASPVTGWVPVVSVNLSLRVFPSDETVSVSVYMTFPSFFSIISTSLAFTTFTAMVSKYGCPVTFWSDPSAFTATFGTQVRHSYILLLIEY